LRLLTVAGALELVAVNECIALKDLLISVNITSEVKNANLISKTGN
jgi:hypothetical protein